MVKRLIVGMIAGLALAALGTHLNAYVFSGHRWPGNSVPFYVNPVNQDVTQSAAITALQVAASNWKNQSTADINIYYAGTTTGGTIANNGKNEIFFRNESNGSTGAVTYWWYGGDGKLMDADMMFYDAGFKFFTGQSGCSSGIYIEDLATHEFGHFLGINHSGDTTATMYPTISAWCNQSWRFLAQDDITAVQLAYPASSPSSGVPSAPTGTVAALAATSPQVNVTWTDASSNETGFRVERSTDGVNFTIVGQPGTNIRSFLDQSTAFNIVYKYRVRAVNASGVSAASNTASVQTPAGTTTAPAAPKLYKPGNNAKRVTSATAGGYYVRWYSVSGATSYDVYFGTTSNPPRIATVVPPAGVSTATPGTMYQAVTWSSRKTYYWKVVAKNASGSTSSATWKFTTK
jgi:Matrixin